MDAESLLPAVDRAFELTSSALRQWDDPHPPPDRLVADEEYSRVTDPGRWRIIGARVDAWLDALMAEGLATVERGAAVDWEEPPGPIVTRTDLVRPTVAGGLPLVVGRTRIEAVEDAGIVLGVGLPAVPLVWIPDCGCDACDSGSADVIDQVDTWIGGIVRGELRHLVRPRRTITVIGSEVRRSSYSPELPTGDGWRWTVAPAGAEAAVLDGDLGLRPSARIDIDAVLADPTGWREWSGPRWLA
ncbi:MAG: DUF6226 family protein [Acidimicrobiia bacterium]